MFRQVLDQVATNLNEIHSVHYSTRYWNILVGAWLQQFADMVMFRMFDIERKAELPTASAQFPPANSLKQFHEFSKSESFVARLHYDTSVQLQRQKISEGTAVTDVGNSQMRTSGRKFSRSFVTATYLSRKTEVLLNLRLGRIPQRLKAQNLPEAKRNSELRYSLSKSNSNNSFRAQTIIALLPSYMPCIYVEHYVDLNQTKKPWRSKRPPKAIFTANRHLYDDVFNYWTALAVESGSQLVLAQHGGNYGISEFPSFSERHECLVADRYITWGWKTEGPAYRGFALPLNGRKLHPSRSKVSLLVITDQLWKYPRSIFSDMSEGSTYLDHLKSTINRLQPEIRHNALLRIHHAHQDAASSQIAWWKLHAPDIKQDLGDIHFETRLNESRLVLIAHNGTSIPDAIALNAPTIITWNDSYMKVRNSAETVFKALEEAGVFHRTPESAASFINSIWNDVDTWWNSPVTIEARKQFTDQYARTVPNPVRFLTKALQF